MINIYVSSDNKNKIIIIILIVMKTTPSDSFDCLPVPSNL